MKYNFILFLLILSACNRPKEKELKTYIDLKGYFDSEARRLTKSNPLIKKTVARNDATETRPLKDINWKTELSLFAESDINKQAWKDSYKVSRHGYKTIYLATDNTLKTREINITQDPQGKIKKILIRNQTDNMLYSSTEQLVYIPDSLYEISKQQHVAVIGDNRYFINGNF
jgi:hypothetical protein